MLKVGDRVRVMLPSKESAGANTVAQFHGVVTNIKSIRAYQKGTSSLGRSFTLEGCATEFGIDYEFCEEWLIPWDEEVTV